MQISSQSSAKVLDLNYSQPSNWNLRERVTPKPYSVRNNRTSFKLAQQTSDKIMVSPLCPISYNVFLSFWTSKTKISFSWNYMFPLLFSPFFFMAGSQRWHRTWNGSFWPRKITWLFTKTCYIEVLKEERTSHSYRQAVKFFIIKSHCQVILQFQLISYGIYYCMVMFTSYASKTHIHKTKLVIKNLDL